MRPWINIPHGRRCLQLHTSRQIHNGRQFPKDLFICMAVHKLGTGENLLYKCINYHKKMPHSVSASIDAINSVVKYLKWIYLPPGNKAAWIFFCMIAIFNTMIVAVISVMFSVYRIEINYNLLAIYYSKIIFHCYYQLIFGLQLNFQKCLQHM